MRTKARDTYVWSLDTDALCGIRLEDAVGADTGNDQQRTSFRLRSGTMTVVYQTTKCGRSAGSPPSN